MGHTFGTDEHYLTRDVERHRKEYAKAYDSLRIFKPDMADTVEGLKEFYEQRIKKQQKEIDDLKKKQKETEELLGKVWDALQAEMPEPPEVEETYEKRYVSDIPPDEPPPDVEET